MRCFLAFTGADLTTTETFIKWAGGKSALLPQFERFLPVRLNQRGYVEPFMGSAAVFLHVVQTRNPARCTLLDVNPDLVNLFVQVRDNLPALLPLLQSHRDHHNAPGITKADREAYYYAVRAAAPPRGSVESAARFLYLNKTCFNGLHRLNSKGKFNVPMGSYAEPSIFDPAHLAWIQGLLEGVCIESCGFRAAERTIRDGDFVYFDPPYEPLSRSSSFTAYSTDLFTQDDQTALRDLCERISPRCTWMLSNSTAPFIEDLYDRPGMFKHHVQASRRINSKADGRGKIAELVVTNYEVG